MFSGKVTFLGFFRLVYRIEVAGLPCQSCRFTVSKSPPVCRVKVAGLPYRNQSRRFAVSKSPVYCIEVAGLLCQSRGFTVSKSPVCRVKVAGLPYRNRCRFAVSKSPVCRVEVTGENEIKSDENKSI